MSDSLRLFIGLSPDAGCRRILAETAACLQRVVPGRYIAPENYHLTLAFLGQTGTAQLPVIQNALLAAATGMQPLRGIALGPAGTFGSILHRGFLQETPLDNLAQRVRALIENAGVFFDAKPFKAHITLARGIQCSAGLHALALPEGYFSATSLILYESRRHGEHLAYHKQMDIPFCVSA